MVPRSIRARVLAAFVLSLAAVAGALGYGLVQLRDIGAGIAILNRAYLPLAEVAAELEAVVATTDRKSDRVTRESPRPLSAHRATTEMVVKAVPTLSQRGRVIVADAAPAVRDERDRIALDAVAAALDEIESSTKAYEASVDTWIAAENDELTQTDRALGELDRNRQQLALMTANLSALVQGRITHVGEHTAGAQRRAFVVSGSLAVLALALSGLMVGVVLLTLRPIGQLTAQVQRLAGGAPIGAIDVRSGDEVGVLAREFNAMAAAVAERDRRLSERAEALDRLSLRLRQVLDTIQAGLVVIEDGRVAMLNPAASRLWGVTDQASPRAELAGLEPGRQEAVAIDGGLFDIAVVPFGESGTLVVGEDVTAITRERERAARNERLALVGQMLAQVTHEIRNPLNAMSLNAELLAEELGDDDESAAMLATITGEIRRLEQLTSRYLDLSRAREAEPSPEDPAGLVRSVVRLEEEALRRAGVEVTVHADSLGTVDLDGDALRRAVRNVLRNAVEAGAHTITLSVARSGESVRVVVRDDGPGMTDEQLDRAFEPFYTTKSRGTGLGLAISRQDLERAGGSLHCESRPGAGTAFTLDLPGSWE